jgi:NAD(P)H-dependent FMN reductase
MTADHAHADLRIAIVLSTTRPDRFGDRPAAWLSWFDLPKTRMELVDLRNYSLPLFSEPDAPRVSPPSDVSARKFAQQIATYDGYVFVTAEYNHGIPAVLKNALDYVGREMRRKPAAFVGYGGLGAARAIEQLRLICIELGMAPIRESVHITRDPYLAVAQGRAELSAFSNLNEEAARALKELTWWARALRNGPCT